MTVNLYRLWLDSKEMRRYRRGCRLQKRFYQMIEYVVAGLIIIGPALITLLVILNETVSKKTAIIMLLFTFYWFIVGARTTLISDFIEKNHKKLSEFLWYSIPVHRHWEAQHSPEVFGSYWLSQAANANIETKTIAEAFEPFLVQKNINYRAFAEYCETEEQKYIEVQERFEKLKKHVETGIKKTSSKITTIVSEDTVDTVEDGNW